MDNTWIIKNCIHKCVNGAASSKQLLGDLLLNKMTPNRSFLACGIDYPGPTDIFKYGGRGDKTTNCYILLCVYFAIKALH